MVLTALAGHDPRDPASLAAPAVDYRPGAEVEAAVRRAVGQLEALGAQLVEIDIPMTRYIQATQWGLMVPEATAYHEGTLRTVPDLYRADVRILLEAGELMTAGDYLRAQRSRTLMQREWARMLGEVDVIAAPTVPTTAVGADQETITWPDGTVEGVSDAFVRLSAPANITGVPALSVPVERALLRGGHAYERKQPARALAPAA